MHWHMTLAERFADKHMPEPNSGCWLWLGNYRPFDGYGLIDTDRHSLNRKSLRAHRVSYELHKGKIPPRMMVLHTCDTPACVNPDHLFLGTHQDNMDDRTAKGRTRNGELKGEDHGMALITAADVHAIRKSKEILRILSERYGICISQVSNIKRGISWKCLPWET